MDHLEPQFNKLRAVLEEEDLFVLKALSTLLHRNGVDAGIKSYVQLLYFFGLGDEFLSRLLGAEVQNTRDAFSLFRETTAISLIMSTYMNVIGRHYLHTALSSVLQRVVDENVSSSDHDTIKTLCKQLMCSLRSTVYEMPHELIRVCGTLMYHSKQKFCHDEYTALVGLLFLRFICPSIASPVQYGTIESGEALRLEPLKSFALLSKLVLMAGTGARFSEGSDCCPLNGELTSWSVEALSLLSMIIDQAELLMEGGGGGPSAGMRRENLCPVVQVTLYCDEGRYKVPIFPHTTARAVREVLLRQMCGGDVDKRSMDSLRFKYQGYQLFLVSQERSWNVLEFVQALSSGTSPEPASDCPLLVEDDEIVHFFQSDEFSLFFVHLDETIVKSVKVRKEVLAKLQSQVRVRVGEQVVSIKVSSGSTVADVVELCLCKLSVWTYGNEDPESVRRIREQHRGYWLYAVRCSSSGKVVDRALLGPHQSVTLIPTYTSLPLGLEFKKTTPQEAIIIDRQSMSAEATHFVRVQTSVGMRSIAVRGDATTITVADTLLRKVALETLGSSVNVIAVQKLSACFKGQWLYQKFHPHAPSLRRSASASAAVRTSASKSQRKQRSHILSAINDRRAGRRSKREQQADVWEPCPVQLCLTETTSELVMRTVEECHLARVQGMLREYIRANDAERDAVSRGESEDQVMMTATESDGEDDEETTQELPSGDGEGDEGRRKRRCPSVLPIVAAERRKMHFELLDHMQVFVLSLASQEFEICRIALESCGLTLADMHAAEAEGFTGETDERVYSKRELEVMEKMIAFRHALDEVQSFCAQRSSVTIAVPTPYATSLVTDLANGWTPLHVAAHNCDLEVIEMLLQGCSNVNMQNDDGNTALHYFAGSNWPQLPGRCEAVLYEFLRKGADLSCVNRFDETPLHRAIFRRRPIAVSMLLRCGSNPNARTITMSALEMAVQMGSTSIVKLLHRAGATATSEEMDRMKVEAKPKMVQLLDSLFCDVMLDSATGTATMEPGDTSQTFSYSQYSEAYSEAYCSELYASDSDGEM